MSNPGPPAGSTVDFDLHGKVHMAVDASAPAVLQLTDIFRCFRVDAPPTSSPDLFVSAPTEDVPDLSDLEGELSYDDDTLVVHATRAQVVQDGDRFRLHGNSELLTSALPLVDRLMATRGAAMFHAATVEYKGYGVAMPAAGGTGKTSTISKLMRMRDDFGFMGDDWAFMDADKQMLGFAKPMFIKPHHRPLYPHLFEGARKPLVPVRLSKPIGRMTTVVHPYVVRYPRLAAAARHWSPEHKMVMPERALPDNRVTTSAPLLVSIYLERYAGSTLRLVPVSTEWMVDRMLGNFHYELPKHSQELYAAMGAVNMLPQRRHFEEKAAVLEKAIDGIPTYLMQVPSAWSPDDASDAIVESLLRTLGEIGVQ